MSAPFIGEIIMFGGNFAPRNWAFCDGELLPIDQNTALFSLIGTVYGGDGRTTTGLPDMRGRAPVHSGASTGPGLTRRNLGSRGGANDVTLATANLPSHTHTVRASSVAIDVQEPDNHVLAKAPVEFYGSPSNVQAMHADSIAHTGGGQSHTNMQPYLAVNFIIALTGAYPSRA